MPAKRVPYKARGTSFNGVTGYDRNIISQTANLIIKGPRISQLLTPTKELNTVQGSFTSDEITYLEQKGFEHCFTVNRLNEQGNNILADITIATIPLCLNYTLFNPEFSNVQYLLTDDPNGDSFIISLNTRDSTVTYNKDTHEITVKLVYMAQALLEGQLPTSLKNCIPNTSVITIDTNSTITDIARIMDENIEHMAPLLDSEVAELPKTKTKKLATFGGGIKGSNELNEALMPRNPEAKASTSRVTTYGSISRNIGTPDGNRPPARSLDVESQKDEDFDSRPTKGGWCPNRCVIS